MQKSNINPQVLQAVLESGSNAAGKGQAQYFTPRSWANLLCQPLAPFRPVAVDLCAGNGSLLKGTDSDTVLGCDIDPCGDFVQADITRFQALLRQVNFKADLFVLNPPWDIHWHRDRLAWLAQSPCPAVAEAFAAHDGRTGRDFIDSTIASLCLALAFCSDMGEGFLVANDATLQRLIFAPGAPHRALLKHIWARITIEGNICAGPSSFKTGVIYFSRSPQTSYPAHYETRHYSGPAQEGAMEICGVLTRLRIKYRTGPETASYNSTASTVELWQAAADEWQVRTGRREAPAWNVWLEGSVIRTDLSLFDQNCGKLDAMACKRLLALNGSNPMSLVVQRNDRRELEAAVVPGSPWKVQPEVMAAVAMAIKEYDAHRAPLKPLNKIQRLGYLDELDTIECERDLLPHFLAGQRYPVRTQTVQVSRHGTKINNSGLPDAVKWTGSELCIYIGGQCFMEGKLRNESVEISLPLEKAKAKRDEVGNAVQIDCTLQQLADHFIIPDVPDVATLYPEAYARNLELLREIEMIVNV